MPEVTWDHLGKNLAELSKREELYKILAGLNTDSKPRTLQNWVSQIWPFAHDIKKDDLGGLAFEDSGRQFT